VSAPNDRTVKLERLRFNFMNLHFAFPEPCMISKVIRDGKHCAKQKRIPLSGIAKSWTVLNAQAKYSML
jgi:hypothetical protein